MGYTARANLKNMNIDFFISFGTTQGNLGVVIVSAKNPHAALKKVNSLGINPGGEAAMWPCSKSEADKLGRDKLLTRAELSAHGYKSNREVSNEQKKNFMDAAYIVCQSCNESLTK